MEELEENLFAIKMVLDESDKQIAKSAKSVENCAWSFHGTIEKIGFWFILICKVAILTLCVCCIRWCEEQKTTESKILVLFYHCAYCTSIALGMYMVFRICIDILKELTN